VTQVFLRTQETRPLYQTYPPAYESSVRVKQNWIDKRNYLGGK
jgi:hypothetical protein